MINPSMIICPLVFKEPLLKSESYPKSTRVPRNTPQTRPHTPFVPEYYLTNNHRTTYRSQPDLPLSIPQKESVKN